MTIRYVSHIEDFIKKVRDDLQGVLDDAGDHGAETVAVFTPVDTGYAARSVHYVVLDNTRTMIAGEMADSNGNPPPLDNYPTKSYDMTLYVGSNTAPRIPNHPYYFELELGKSPQGAGMLAHGLDETVQFIRDKIKP